MDICTLGYVYRSMPIVEFSLTTIICCSAVLDEVDILFGDEDFEVALLCLINSSPVATQYLFVTATLPKDVYSKLVEVFPDCEMIMGPSMHRISPRLEEVRFQLQTLFFFLLFYFFLDRRNISAVLT